MDKKAFYKLSYGLYVVGSRIEETRAGCVVNTLAQVTASPSRMSVTVNKDNYTEQIIERSGLFTAVALTQDADMDIIGAFGFQTSRDTDKFTRFQTKEDENGIPYLVQNAAARYSCRVRDKIDVGTHVLFIGDVLEAEVLSQNEVLTYAYYQQVKKGGTPKNAPSYQGADETAEKRGYRCSVCGYILESDTIPEGFRCPICGQGPDMLRKQ